MLAGASLGRVYNGPLLVWLVAGAALGSALTSAALRWAPGWLATAASVGALAAYTLAAFGISAAAGGVAGSLVDVALDAGANAVPRLLTSLIPVEAQPDSVFAPVVLAWLAGFTGAELATRARRPAVALVPPTLLYGSAVMLVGPNADVVLWQPLVFAVLAAISIVAGTATSGPARVVGIAAGPDLALRLRSGVGAAAGLAVVLALAAVIAPLVALAVRHTPTDPRRYVDPPRLDLLDQNPLMRISGWAANPDQRLFEVTVQRHARPDSSQTPIVEPAPSEPPSEPPSDDGTVLELPEDETTAPTPEPNEADAHDTRLRLAVLSAWDGVTWHVSADYRNAGRVLPPISTLPGPDDGLAGEAPPLTIEQRITVAELEGRLLPAVSAPRRVEGVRVAYDEETGTLLHAAPLAPGLSYTVTSVNPSVDVSMLPAADVPSGPMAAGYLAVGDAVPTDLSRLAERVSTGESSPYLRALALETFISEHYRYAADAPSGHAYPNLRFFLFDDPRAGGRQGTSEQFATAFATIGRLMGLPTRVVVGFRTPTGGGSITGADVLAWPEVLFSGIGWVAFDPMPRSDTQPRPLEDEYLPKPPPPTPPPPSVEPPDEPTWSAPPTSAGAVAAPVGSGIALVAGGVGGCVLALLVAIVVAVVLLRAARRRSRMDSGSPPQRVLGAWAEVLDALLLAGSPPAAHLAAVEVAAHASAVAEAAPGRRHSRSPRPAAPPLEDLATAVNAVGFAGGTSGPPGGADELVAAGARNHALAYVRALRARRSWWRRLLWRIDPRPLLGRRPRRPSRSP